MPEAEKNADDPDVWLQVEILFTLMTGAGLNHLSYFCSNKSLFWQSRSDSISLLLLFVPRWPTGRAAVQAWAVAGPIRTGRRPPLAACSFACHASRKQATVRGIRHPGALGAYPTHSLENCKPLPSKKHLQRLRPFSFSRAGARIQYYALSNMCIRFYLVLADQYLVGVKTMSLSTAPDRCNSSQPSEEKARAQS